MPEHILIEYLVSTIMAGRLELWDNGVTYQREDVKAALLKLLKGA